MFMAASSLRTCIQPQKVNFFFLFSLSFSPFCCSDRLAVRLVVKISLTRRLLDPPPPPSFHLPLPAAPSEPDVSGERVYRTFPGCAELRLLTVALSKATYAEN